MRHGFTLIELLVVVAILVLLSLIAIPAISALARSGAETQAKQMLQTSVVTASTLANYYGAPVALRVGRAYELDANNCMRKNAAGQPLWKNHQQITVAVSGFRQDSFPVFGCTGKTRAGSPEMLDEARTFRRVKSTPALDLPSLVWLASDIPNPDEEWQPSNPQAAAFNRLDTFYVVFNHRGELSTDQSTLLYLDETQPYQYKGSSAYPVVDCPDPAARGVRMYARGEYLSTKQMTGPTLPIQTLR